MSTIRVHDIEGISTYSNTVRVPSGHTLDIDGDLRLPVYTTATLPGSGTEGQMVYDSSTKSIKVWNGNAWTAAGVTQSGDGSSENSPGTSAAAILASNPSSSTGFYWIKNAAMSVPVRVYCDMSYDGGGWMLLAYGFCYDTGTSSNNRNLPNLNCNDETFTYNATSRASTHGLVPPKGQQQTAVKLTQASTQWIMAAGGNPSTGGCDSYNYIYRFNIPSPSQTDFANHSHDNASGFATSTVTITGLKGDVGSWSRYCFTRSIGATWSDTYPTGYGCVSGSGVRGWNSNGGPFFPSVHPGCEPRNNGTGWYSGPDVYNGRREYTYRGWYRPQGSVNQTGQTSIWTR